MSDAARDGVLARVRRSLGAEPVTLPSVMAEWQSIPRGYERAPQRTSAAKIDLLESRLCDYDAQVTRVPELETAACVAQILSARGAARILLPPGFPAAWQPLGYPFTVDQAFSPRELAQFEGCLSGATLAIAETGSLVLQSVPGQGRRALSLVPDFHLCVVRCADVVETVPEAFVRLHATAHLPTTFVSGPSATADIEMTRIKGVHGPRFLHVILAS